MFKLCTNYGIIVENEKENDMQKDFKKDFEDKYNDILKSLCVQWKLQHKRKYEELQDKGLLNSGLGSKEMYNLIKQIINHSIVELQELFTTLPIKYNRKISLNDLKKYEEKTKNNIKEHIDNMEKDIEKIYGGDKLLLGDTNKIFIENIKNNSILKIEKIFQEIMNLRKGKKIEGLVIFDIFFTLLGFVVGVASLIVEILDICK